MAKLLWGLIDQKTFESGIDRGVLYPLDGPGVPWNGLVSVSESAVGNDLNSYTFDGIKYLDMTSPSNYQATLTAFSAPDEFGPSLGDLPIVPGFILTRQPRRRFGLSYRTLIGDGTAYKIHIVYNASTSPNSIGYSSIDDSTDTKNLAWTIDAVPPASNTYRPSAHFIVDSTKMDPAALKVIETILYGSDTDDPRLLDVDELIGIAGFWSPVLVVVPPTDIVDGGTATVQVAGTDDGGTSTVQSGSVVDGGIASIGVYAQLVPGVGDLYRTTVPGVLHLLPDSRLVETSYNSGYYEMES